MKRSIHIICAWLVNLLPLVSLAQKVDIVNRSAFRHNYVVTSFDYLERSADTSRLKYIATLKIHVDDYPYIITNFFSRLKTEAKELGGNVFCLDSYSEKDSSVTISVRTYFATEKFLAENKNYRDKNKVYVFSAERKTGFKQLFYLNDSLVLLPSTHYYTYTPTDNEIVRVAVSKPKPVPAGLPASKRNKFTSGRDSRFVIVGHRVPNSDGMVVGIAFGLVGYAIYKSTQEAKYADLDYPIARMLLDVYPAFTK